MPKCTQGSTGSYPNNESILLSSKVFKTAFKTIFNLGCFLKVNRANMSSHNKLIVSFI